MGISGEEARELVESVFTFDNVGDAMFAVRKDAKSEAKKEELVKQLVEAAVKESNQNDAASLIVIQKAAVERVDQYAKGSQASQSGCSGL
jgi:hypothetical protein